MVERYEYDDDLRRPRKRRRSVEPPAPRKLHKGAFKPPAGGRWARLLHANRDNELFVALNSLRRLGYGLEEMAEVSGCERGFLRELYSYLHLPVIRKERVGLANQRQEPAVEKKLRFEETPSVKQEVEEFKHSISIKGAAKAAAPTSPASSTSSAGTDATGLSSTTTTTEPTPVPGSEKVINPVTSGNTSGNTNGNTNGNVKAEPLVSQSGSSKISDSAPIENVGPSKDETVGTSTAEKGTSPEFNTTDWKNDLVLDVSEDEDEKFRQAEIARQLQLKQEQIDKMTQYIRELETQKREREKGGKEGKLQLLAELRAQKAAKEDKVKAIEARYDLLNTEIDEAMKSIKEKQDEVSRLVIEAETAGPLVSELERQIEDLEKDIEGTAESRLIENEAQ